MAMITAELEAAIAALLAKKDALREAFDRLAACSPFPLPFTWDDLDAHISSLQSSISLRFRQLRVLETARPAPSASAAAATGDDEKGKNQGEEASEEEEEYEEVEEDEDEEEVVVEVEEEEDDEEVDKAEEEVDANDEAEEKEQKVDEEMQDIEEEEVKVDEQEELEANDEANDKEQKDDKEGDDEEEQEQADDETREAKTVSPEQCIQEEKGEAKMSPKLGDLALQGANKDLVAACARMDTTRLVEVVCKNIGGRKEYPGAMRHAPDAAALVLCVVRDFLPNKEHKTNRVWENCVGMIRCVPVVTPKLSVRTVVHARGLAKDWKKMIDKPGSCGDLGMLASWALLYFLISYDIVSEFDADEIICLFGTVPRKYQKKNCIELCKGLGLINRITDLIDYLIGNGQYLGAVQMTHVLNLVDKYPPLSLLEGYVEKAKGTALDLFSKNASHKTVNPAISKEVENLWFAHTMVKQQSTDSSQWSVILAEIKNLIDEYTKKRSLINASVASTSNSGQQQKSQQKQQQQKEKPHDVQQKQKKENKKRKKEQQQHEGQDIQLQRKQRKLQGKQEQQQTKPQEKQQQQHKAQDSKGQQQHKPQESKGQQQHKPQEKQQKQQQNKPQQRQQQHLNRPRPSTTRLPTPVVPASGVLPPVVLNVAQIDPFGRPPYAVMPAVHSYPAQPSLPGIQGGPFAPNVGAPQFNPYQQNPLYRHPSFYHR